MTQAGAGENALVQLKTALSTALTVLRSGAGKYCDLLIDGEGSRPYVEAETHIVPGALQLR